MNSRLKKLKYYRAFTASVLFLENMTLALWKAFFWVLFFFGFWLFELQTYFLQNLHPVIFCVFAAGLFFWIWRGRHFVAWPSKQEINRRLEKSSDLANRPLSFIEDTPVSGDDKKSAYLWQRARARYLETLRRLRTPTPRPLLPALDRRAFRLGVLLFAISGFFVAGPYAGQRLWNGLAAPALFLPGAPAKTMLVTITPPDYTGVKQTLIEGPAYVDSPVDVPLDSVLKFTAQSSLGGLSLFIDDQEISLDKAGPKSYSAETKLVHAKHFSLSQFLIPRFTIPLNLLPDEPPRIKIVEQKDPEKPQDTHYILPESTVRFPLSVYDDYGVKDITMHMVLDPVVEDAPLGYPVSDTRSVMSPGGADFMFDPVYDFTSSPWAGLPAQVSFEVSDALGQTAQLDPISIVLPERVFRHPVSKTLVELRKQLAWAPTAPPDEIIDALEALLATPDSYQNDLVVILGLRSASSRLFHASEFEEGLSKDDAWDVMALLWDTALRIEDGNLSIAARNLREAQRDLENALKSGDASEEEILELTDQVRAYLQEYLAELQKELQKRMENGDEMAMIPPELLSKSLDKNMLDQFMQQMQSELMQGNKDKAQDMLSQLQRMLDSLNPSLVQPMPFGMQMMQEGVDELQQLIDSQKELRDQTQMQAEMLQQQRLQIENFEQILEFNAKLFEQLAQQDIPLPPGLQEFQDMQNLRIDTSAHKVEQDALRFILGQLMIDAGQYFEDMPENLGLAELDMRESADKLEDNAPDLSVPHQDDAIEHLEEARKEMSQQMMEKMQQMMGSGGMAFFMLPGMRPGEIDPLGRPFSPDKDGMPSPFYAPVEIPDEERRQKIQDILKLLRERSGELERPEEELEYFKRLLKQF